MYEDLPQEDEEADSSTRVAPSGRVAERDGSTCQRRDKDTGFPTYPQRRSVSLDGTGGGCLRPPEQAQSTLLQLDGLDDHPLRVPQLVPPLRGRRGPAQRALDVAEELEFAGRSVWGGCGGPLRRPGDGVFPLQAGRNSTHSSEQCDRDPGTRARADAREEGTAARETLVTRPERCALSCAVDVRRCSAPTWVALAIRPVEAHAPRRAALPSPRGALAVRIAGASG